MSRLSSLSPAAIKAMFSTESSDTLITLLTVYDPNTSLPAVRLADNYLNRITTQGVNDISGMPLTTDDGEVIYGVTSRSNQFIFIPMQISLPSEEDNVAPKCSLVINDVTRHITPIIRTLTAPPKILLELVLTSSPSTVEASFAGFYISNFIYNADSVTAELTMIDYQVEPFPSFTFTPAYFPGLY